MLKLLDLAFLSYVYVWGHRGVSPPHWKAKRLINCYSILLCNHAYTSIDIHILSRLIVWYWSLVCTTHLPQLEGKKYFWSFYTGLNRVFSIMRVLPLSHIWHKALLNSLWLHFPLLIQRHWSILEEWFFPSSHHPFKSPIILQPFLLGSLFYSPCPSLFPALVILTLGKL